MESQAVISQRPASGDLIDLGASAGVLGPNAWSVSRNVMYRDDGTPTRRDGLRSTHIKFDNSGDVVQAESPDNYEVLGLTAYTRIRNTKSRFARFFVAKIDQYLVGSRVGEEFNIPLASGLGVRSVADFTPVYRSEDKQMHLVVMTEDEDFAPLHWNGSVAEWNANDGDFAKWGFMSEFDELPSGRFAVVHNNFLFVAAQDGQTIYQSAGLDFLDFDGGWTFVTDPRFGKVTGFFPTFYGELIIGQEYGIMRTGFGEDGGISYLLPLSTEIGLMNNQSTAQIGGDLYYRDSRGQVRSLSTTDKFGDLITGAQSSTMFTRFAKQPKSAWPAAFLVDDPDKHVLWCGHSLGSGTRNDSMTGWDYRHDRWVTVENEGIGGFSCAAAINTPRWNRKKIFFGSYSIAPADTGTYGTAGRIWTFDPGHKEDIFLSDRTSSTNTSTTLYHDPIVRVPESGGFGSAASSTLTSAQIDPQGEYADTGESAATVILRVTTAGTPGGIPGPVLELDDRNDGTWEAVSQNLAAGGYTPGDRFDVAGATRDTGFTMELPNVALAVGEEIALLSYQGSKRVETYISDLPDLQNGLRMCQKSEGTAYNFVPYIETAGLYLEDPHREMHIDGITVVTKTVGNRADTATAGEDVHANQNQYRWFLDVYARMDDDVEWSQIGIIDGNSAGMYHCDQSKAEAAGYWPERDDLKYTTPADGLEATGPPMARNSQVNIEYIRVDETCRVYWLRFGQETMASLDHEGVAGTNVERGIRHGDFTIVSVHVHYSQGRASSASMNRKSASIYFDVPGVVT